MRLKTFNFALLWLCKFIAFLINYKIEPYQLVMVDEAD